MNPPNRAPVKSTGGLKKEEVDPVKNQASSLHAGGKSKPEKMSKRMGQEYEKAMGAANDLVKKAAEDWIERPHPPTEATTDLPLSNATRRKLQRLQQHVARGIANPLGSRSEEYVSCLQHLTRLFTESLAQNDTAAAEVVSNTKGVENGTTVEEKARMRRGLAADLLGGFVPPPEFTPDRMNIIEEVRKPQQNPELVVEDESKVAPEEEGSRIWV